MKALRIYAGPAARRHIEQNGLQPSDVRVIPAAAGGPKGLILGPLDRFIFGEWLTQSTQPIDLIGASIGAWRMATACLNHPVEAFERLEHDYIHQEYDIPAGRKRPTAEHVSQRFGENLKQFYGGRVKEVLNHPRYRLHVVTSRGRHILGREHPVLTPLGYAGAYLTNLAHRRALGGWLQRVVFSAQNAALPFQPDDYRTHQVELTEDNFNDALQASCSIPFALKAVHDIAGAPAGAYWDGGITDYHLHLDYRSQEPPGIVLYPHFQKQVIPGWLDKALARRHGATSFLDNVVVLAPDPEWVQTLPNGKLPDRTDFSRYSAYAAERKHVWTDAASHSTLIAQEFAGWLNHGNPSVEPL